jgi:hypothetical protein
MQNGQRKVRKLLFLFVTAADEAQFKYDGNFDVPEDLRRRWAVEIEEAKKDLLVARIRDRSSFSYWLQWLFPLICVICAVLEPERLVELLLLGFGGSFGTNVSRKVSKHVYLNRTANLIAGSKTEETPAEPEVLAPENDEPDDGANAPMPPEDEPTKP